MIYALAIVLLALILHAITKFKEIASVGMNPLDEANLVESIEESTQPHSDLATAGGDGQQGIADHAFSVQSPTPERSNLAFRDQIADEGDSWVSDIKFTDDPDENDQNEKGRS